MSTAWAWPARQHDDARFSLSGVAAGQSRGNDENCPHYRGHHRD
jgi:hypothetical protein